jgi:hypothetical protein
VITALTLSLLVILSAFYAKLAKLLGPSPFPHALQHVAVPRARAIAASGRATLFPESDACSPADEALWNVALGSTALGGTAPGGGMLSSPHAGAG